MKKFTSCSRALSLAQKKRQTNKQAAPANTNNETILNNENFILSYVIVDIKVLRYLNVCLLVRNSRKCETTFIHSFRISFVSLSLLLLLALLFYNFFFLFYICYSHHTSTQR